MTRLYGLVDVVVSHVTILLLTFFHSEYTMLQCLFLRKCMHNTFEVRKKE